MSKKVKSGFFITLEGGEGAGKTTQIQRLVVALEKHNYEIVVTREPGGTPEAERIRELLVQRDGGDWTPMAEILLFFAARAMHIETLIKPALAEGKVVVCDRFTDSTIAYQGYGKRFDIPKIKEIEKLSINRFEPDLTFILDIDVKEGLARANNRLAQEEGEERTEDRFERMDVSFHEKLRQGFLEIARQNPERCYIVDAARPFQEISDEIIKVALARIEEK